MYRRFSFFVTFVLVLCLFGNAWALNWADKDIGSANDNPGGSSEAAGVWTIQGSGHDIWGGNDGFHYVYRPLSGDGSLEVRLISQDNTSGWAKAGPMIRETATASSKHEMSAMTPGNGVQYVYRPTTGGESFGVNRTGEFPPVRLRITRTGDQLLSEFQDEPIPGLLVWTVMADEPIPMNAVVTIGMAVNSAGGALNTTVFEDVILTAPPVEFAWALSPEDGASKQPVDGLTLSWIAGDSATSHDIYLGTDPAALGLLGSQAVGDEDVDLTGLDEGTQYYWQIVEQPSATASAVMSFKTARSVGGEVCLDIWWGFGGGQVSDLLNHADYPSNPHETRTLSALDTGTDLGDNYGARIQGFLIPETSGDYTFWIASDDASQLWLSPSEKSCEAQLIAQETGWASYHDYDGNASRKSAPISLVGGEQYFIRVLFKEGGGGDHCSVAWEGPDSPSRSEIDSYYLAACGFVDTSASNPSLNGETVTPLEAEILSFMGAPGATEHQVLFGETGSMALLTTLPAGETSFVAPVEAGKSYEWQINEVFGVDVEVGCPWSFGVEEWISRDIGRSNPDPAGSSSYNAGTDTYTLNTTGSFELWGENDEFHYLYTTMRMTRDQGEITARVMSIDPQNSWRRGGVMIRESRAPNSRKVMAHKTGHDNLRMQWRDNPGNGTGNSGDNWDLGFPRWVRLVRDGNQYNGFRSADGVNWTQLGSRNINMSSNGYVLVGLALCHHPSQPADQFTVGMFDNFTITTPDPGKAWNLEPESGATMVDIHAVLRWNAGEGVSEHRVYFSADEEAVANRTVDPTILPAETTELAVGPLTLTNTYYWAVDEVVNPVIPGDVMSFTVENYRTIDDFESYDVAPEALPAQQRVPGEILVEAVPPPDQDWVDAQDIVLVEALDPGTDCLIAEWAFEDNFDDTSGSGFHGTPMGGVGIIDDAERGKVGSFDGTDDYVDCGNPAALNFGTGNWTICAWIKTSETGRPKGHILANGGDGGGGIRYALASAENKDDRLTLICDDNVKKKQSNSDTHITDGVWHHVVGLRNGGRQYLYVDGILEDDDGLPSGYDLSGVSQREVLLGAIWHHGNNVIQKYYTGLIDDAQIYDCALTEGNIRYLAGKDDLTVSKPGYYGPLIAHYDFDEGSGDTALDSSGNGLNGAISGAVYTTVTADGSASCLDFNGFGDNVLNSLAGPYLNNLFELSISMWVQSDLIETDKGFFMGSNSNSDRHGIRYDKMGGSADPDGNDVIKYGVRTLEGNEEDESSQFLQTTEWQHVVMTWQSGVGMTLWINGVKDFPTFDAGAKGSVTDGYNRLHVGKGSKDSADDAGWDGRIDDVRVYGLQLTEGEVRYLAGVGNIALPDRFVPLALHYEFEGNLDDSSGNDRTGTAHGAVGFETDPDRGEVLDLPGGSNQFVSAPEVGISGAAPTTIACWAKADHTSIPNWTLVFGFTGNAGGGGGNDTHFNIGSLGGPGGVGAHVWGWEATIFNDNQALDWRHYAMTYDGGTLRYYGDGTMVGQVNRNLSPRADRVYVGSRVTQDSSFPGNVDDARVYDTALTLGQLRELAEYVPTNGLGDTWSGRASAAPTLEYQEPAHEGSQSMRVSYTGSGAVSRLQPWTDGKHPHGQNGDFSLGTAQALSLWFRGDPDNAPGTMFAQLTTVVPSGHTQRVMYDGDPEDLLNPNWQEWTMSLKALSTGKPADPVEEMGLPITKIKDVGVGIIGGGGGVLYFDDLRLYPNRCIPKYGSAYDLNGDCEVDRADLQVFAVEFLAEPEVQELERVAYYDARYPTGWADNDVAVGVRDYLSMLGYTILDADELKTWMDARIADRALSVVVMCQDIAPDTVAETADASCTLRRYLDRGGKVVQYADIPFYNQGHADGSVTTWATGGSIGILGFNAASAAWNSQNTVTITPDGIDWGLTQAWSPSLRPALASDVDIILATDDDGDAAGWVKHYVPGNTRGFVYIIDLDVNTSHIALLPELAKVAEHIADLTADLVEDDIVNFFDYADLLNHFGDEVPLFPPPGEQL